MMGAGTSWLRPEVALYRRDAGEPLCAHGAFPRQPAARWWRLLGLQVAAGRLRIVAGR